MWPFNSSKQPEQTAVVDAPAVNAPAANAPASDFIRSHEFENVHGSQPVTEEAPTAAGLLHNTALDPAKLHPLANIRVDDLEYLDIDDDKPNTLEGARTALPSRGWSDDLCYGTGTTYLGGLTVGSLMGLREGITRPLGIDNPTMRLRMNAILNQVTRRSTFIGNSAGVIAMTYNLFDASIDAMRGKHDIYGSMASGALSGALFRSASGPRAMLVSSAIMTGAAAAWTGAKRAVL